MSSIQEEIKKHWDTQRRGYAREISSLIDTGFPAWTVILPDGRFGVAVPYSGNEPVFESFASAWIESLAMKNIACDECLVLCSFDSSFAFSSLCAEFVSPGESGKSERIWLRIQLLGGTNGRTCLGIKASTLGSTTYWVNLSRFLL